MSSATSCVWPALIFCTRAYEGNRWVIIAQGIIETVLYGDQPIKAEVPKIFDHTCSSDRAGAGSATQSAPTNGNAKGRCHLTDIRDSASQDAWQANHGTKKARPSPVGPSSSVVGAGDAPGSMSYRHSSFGEMSRPGQLRTELSTSFLEQVASNSSYFIATARMHDLHASRSVSLAARVTRCHPWAKWAYEHSSSLPARRAATSNGREMQALPRSVGVLMPNHRDACG